MSMLSPSMGAATLAGRRSFDPGNIFADFINSTDIPGSIIVEVDGFPNDASFGTGTIAPTMGAPTMAFFSAGNREQPRRITLQLSADGIRFKPDDPVSPGYKSQGRLASRVTIRSEIQMTPQLSGSLNFSVGDIEIQDQDRALEPIIDSHNWAGREVRVKYGPRGATLANYRTIAIAFARDWLRGADGRYRLRLQSGDFSLDRAFQSREFGGTGGLEGGASLVGRLKPRLLGIRRNIEPVDLNIPQGWYMYNDGGAEGISEARLGGEPIPLNIVSTLLEFANFDLAEGEALDCPPLGICRVNRAGNIDSVFTIEARGDNFLSNSSLIGDLISKVFRQFAGFDLTRFDAPSLLAFNIGNGGYWFDGTRSVTIKQVVERLALDAGGRVSATSPFRALPFRDPTIGGADYFLRETEIGEPIGRGRQTKPVLDFIVRYAPNDRPLQEAEILQPESNVDLKQYLQRESISTNSQPLGSILFTYEDFTEQVILDSSIIEGVGASSFLFALKRFFQVERFLWEIPVLTKEALLFPVGSIVNITHRSSTFAGGRNCIVVSNRADYDTQRPTIRVLV